MLLSILGCCRGLVTFVAVDAVMMRLPSLFRTIQVPKAGYACPLGSGGSGSHCVMIAPLDVCGYMVRLMGALKNGMSRCPSFLEVVDDNGVSDPDQSAPNPGPSARSNVTSASLINGRLMSKRGIDKADQKLRLPTDVDVDGWKSLMRAAKLINEQMTTICAIESIVDTTCTMTEYTFRWASIRPGRVSTYLSSRIRNTVNDVANTTMRQLRGSAFDAAEALFISL